MTDTRTQGVEMQDLANTNPAWPAPAPGDGFSQVVDQAIGVLILALRLSPVAAESLLSQVARRELLPLERLGAAVLGRAAGSRSTDWIASEVVRQEWGDLLL